MPPFKLIAKVGRDSMARWEILVSGNQVCAMNMDTGEYTFSCDDPRLPEDVREKMAETIKRVQEKFSKMLIAMKRCKEALEQIASKITQEEIEIEVVGSGGGISGVMGGAAYIPSEEIEKYVKRYTTNPKKDAEHLLRWGYIDEEDPEEVRKLKWEIVLLLAKLFCPVRFVAKKVRVSSGIAKLENPIQELVYVPLSEFKLLKKKLQESRAG